MSDSPKNPGPPPLVPAAGRKPGSDATRRGAGRGPLPDAQAIRACLVPEAAPPYDDAAAAGAIARVAERGPRAAASETAAHPGQPDQAQAALSQAAVSQATVSGRWPSQFAQVLAETLAGSRPARQITPWTTEEARKRISELGPMLSGARQPRVRRVILTSPAQGVLEMTVIADFGARARAVAVRLERPSPRSPAATATRQPGITPGNRQPSPAANWLCTAIEAA